MPHLLIFSVSSILCSFSITIAKIIWGRFNYLFLNKYICFEPGVRFGDPDHDRVLRIKTASLMLEVKKNQFRTVIFIKTSLCMLSARHNVEKVIQTPATILKDFWWLFYWMLISDLQA